MNIQTGAHRDLMASIEECALLKGPFLPHLCQPSGANRV